MFKLVSLDIVIFIYPLPNPLSAPHLRVLTTIAQIDYFIKDGTVVISSSFIFSCINELELVYRELFLIDYLSTLKCNAHTQKSKINAFIFNFLSNKLVP